MVFWFYTVLALSLSTGLTAHSIPGSLNAGNLYYPRPVYITPGYDSSLRVKSTDLIGRHTSTSPMGQPLPYYNIIAQHPQYLIPGNYYIKPGNVVSPIQVDSKPMYTKIPVSQGGRGDLLEKDNIVYYSLPANKQFSEEEVL